MSQFPNHLIVQARTGFLTAIRQANPQWKNIAEMLNMNGSSVNLVDIGATPMPMKNRSGVTVQQVIERSLQVKPDSWDITLHITNDDLEDDQTGNLKKLGRRAGQNFNKHMNMLVFKALNAGTTNQYGLCYDGLTFFNDSHVDSGAKYTTPQDNKLTSADLDVDTFETAYVAASTFLDDQGVPVNFLPNLLVVPPQLMRKAKQIADNPWNYGTANREQNPWKGEVRYLVTPYVDSTAWFLTAATEAAKPLLLVMRKTPYLQKAWFDPEKPNGGWYMFKYYARYTVAYGDWRLAIKGN